MAKVTIGRVEYSIPELNFLAIERAWPWMVESMATQDPILGVSAGIKIIAAGLMELDSFSMTEFGIDATKLSAVKPIDDQVFDLLDYVLKKRLLATEISSVRECVEQIIEEAGFKAPAGELPLESPNPSTEISIPSSPNSSLQDAKEEVGTG